MNKRIKLILNVLTLGILGLVVYSSRHSLAGVIQELTNAKLAFLLLCVPIQLVNYHAYARMYQEVFGLLDEKVGYWDMFKVSVELSFVNYVFPSAGISGFGYFSLRMRSFNVRGVRSTMAQTLRWGIVLASFIPVLGLGVVLLALKNQVSNIVILAASGLSFGVMILILLVIFLLEKKNGLENFVVFVAGKLEFFLNFIKRKPVKLMNKRRMERLEKNFNRLEHDYRQIRKNPKGFIYTSRWGILANLTEIATIGVAFLALGASPAWGAIILAYGVANIGSFVAILPGGHGVYEALMTGVLVSGGVPASLSLTAVLTYRLVTTVLYVPPGYYFYSKAINETKGMVKLLKEEAGSSKAS
jgi:uncharacterized protein (TIRG00374 family)